MALSNTIRNGIEQAFAAAGDLAVDVTLNQSDAVRYNFETGKTLKTSSGSKIVKGILLTANKRSEDGNRIMDTLILRGQDVDNIDVYDSFTINGKEYRVEGYQNYNDFAYEIDVSGG